MSKLGDTFKESREKLGKDRYQIFEETRISEDIVTKLENGEFDKLPSYNHLINFVKQYSRYLQLDVDKCLELAAEECDRSVFNREVKYVAPPVQREAVVKVSWLKYAAIAVVITAAAIVGTYLVISMQKADDAEVVQVVQKTQGETQAEVSAEDDTVTASPEPETATQPEVSTDALQQEAAEEPIAEPAQEVKTDAPAKPVTDNFQQEQEQIYTGDVKTVTLSFTDVCWVHIVVDGGVREYDFIAEAGIQRLIEFRDHFILDVGNAAVVSVSYDDDVIRGLGGYKKPKKNLKFEVTDNDNLVYNQIAQ